VSLGGKARRTLLKSDAESVIGTSSERLVSVIHRGHCLNYWPWSMDARTIDNSISDSNDDDPLRVNDLIPATLPLPPVRGAAPIGDLARHFLPVG
jgi:hypothetical protein